MNRGNSNSVDDREIEACFAADYATARGLFLQSAEAAGCALSAYLHPERGLQNEELSTDVAVLGAESAERALVLASATHGGEGFCGSGIQVHLLRECADELTQAGVALVLVHAHNPHGFSWVRRTNEDNIDLNRNFIDFSAELPSNTHYDELHDWLVPEVWEGAKREQAERELVAWIGRNGPRAYQAAVAGGQYRHRDGLFYGGVEPSWTARTVERIATEHLARYEHTAWLDLHTGLGPRGHGELIYARSPATAEYARLAAWLGEVTSTEDGSSASEPVSGTIDAGYRRVLGDAFTGVVVEYGTLPILDVLEAHRFDAWVHKHRDPRGEFGVRARAQMRRAMFGEEVEWKRAVIERGLEVARGMWRGLAGRA